MERASEKYKTIPKLSFEMIPYLVVIVAICVWQDAYAQPVACNGSPSQANKDVAELEDHPQLTPQIVENLQEYLTRCGDTPSGDGRELFLHNIRWLSQASYRFDNNAALETTPQSASTAVWCEQIATLIEQRAKLLDDWHPYENKVSKKVKIGWGLCQEPQTKTNQDLREIVILWTVDNRRLEREIAKSKQKWQELTADLYRKLPQMAEEAQARQRG